MSGWFATFVALLAVAGCSARTRPNDSDAPTRLAAEDRPHYWEHPLMARWLVHKSNWATIATISDEMGGNAFGRVEDISDGPRGNSTGRLLFYLAESIIVRDISTHENVSVVITEAALTGQCTFSIGAEMPICAQVSIGGPLRRVPDDEVKEAQELVFGRFPAMRALPKKSHGFAVYELHPMTIRLVDFFGGPAFIKAEDYFAVKSSDVDKIRNVIVT